MQERLVLFVNENGQLSGQMINDDPSVLAAVTSGKEIIVVVPGEDVLLTSATLPKLPRARLLQALPYAIEDQLTSEVETLHFVPAAIQADGVTPVAVVAQEKMQQWQSILQSYRIQADSLIPATFVLPFAEDSWYVSITNMATVRTGALSGFTCDVPSLGNWLSVALASTNKKPRIIHIHNYSDQVLALADIKVEIKEEKLPVDQWYQDATQQLDTPSINLLTSGYASRKARFPQMTKVRKLMMYLAGAWLVLLLLYPLVSYVILKVRLSQIQSQMWALYHKQFPQATSMVAPKVRFEDKLHKAGASLGQNRFLNLMAYVSEAIHQHPDIKIKRMDFQSDSLRLDLTAATDDFNAFTDYLTQQGLQVKQQNASVTAERVTATVQVE